MTTSCISYVYSETIDGSCIASFCSSEVELAMDTCSWRYRNIRASLQGMCTLTAIPYFLVQLASVWGAKVCAVRSAYPNSCLAFIGRLVQIRLIALRFGVMRSQGYARPRKYIDYSDMFRFLVVLETAVYPSPQVLEGNDAEEEDSVLEKRPETSNHYGMPKASGRRFRAERMNVFGVRKTTEFSIDEVRMLFFVCC